MKRLLSGTSLAIVLAIAVPACAQTPTTTQYPSTGASPSTAAPTPSTTAPAPSAQTMPSATSPSATPYTQPNATSAQQTSTQTTAPSSPSASTSAAMTERMPSHDAMRREHRGHAGHLSSNHAMRHAPIAASRSRGMNDNIANQLNRQELGRLSGSTVPPRGYQPTAGGGYSQPNAMGR
jgi:hypothetical protein